MKTALWILLAGLLTYVTGAALLNTALSRDRQSLVGNALLSLCMGWYMAASWRRVLRATRGGPAEEEATPTRTAPAMHEVGS
ncbi:hypothetical protein ABZ341_10190 [Streptomyces sp. NPDC006173]|uniref:hypothetical protein n=1 Tax=Streptomyces sp. NPDC006173 TaxID=3155349 RepID=UPI0033F1B038